MYKNYDFIADNKLYNKMLDYRLSNGTAFN